MKEVSSSVSKDQLDSGGKEKRTMEDFLSMRKRVSEDMHNVF